MKTMAIRMEDDTNAVLTVLAQLEGTTVADLIRQAIESLIEAKRSNPELTAKASEVAEAIDAEAAARKQAIQSLMAAEPAPKGRSTRKPTESS